MAKPGLRKIDINDIILPPDYQIEVFAKELTTPINLTFTDEGDMLIADAGVTDGNGKVLRLKKGNFEVVADGFNPPLTGITYHKGAIYVAHRGVVTIILPNGTKKDIIEGLPSWGDHHNNRVVFGTDEKMYFGQGTATNSGVVGQDNQEWVRKYPSFHDYPGSTIQLVGHNYVSKNFLTNSESDTTLTGPYSPFSVSVNPGEVVRGIVRASGSILRANPDGSDLQMVAWGLRNPFRIMFDRNNRLFSTNHGMDVRGSRPVANSPDEFYEIGIGLWYGWPDFTGGQPVTHPQFKPENEPQPQFILAKHPMVPPKPLAAFAPHSAIMGFDFNTNPLFGSTDLVYIAEYGSEAPETTGGIPMPGVGHRVSWFDIKVGQIYPFAMNRSGFAASYTGGGGLERPIDAVFGPDKALYIVDFNYTANGSPDDFTPRTGVIWRITRR